MYNRFLEYLKQPEPEKTISKGGISIRKKLNPLVKAFAPFMSKYKMKVSERKDVATDRPVIFSATHGFRDDILFTMRAIKAHGYILFGNIHQLFYSYEGIAIWLNGVVLVDRTDKESRQASKEKMKYVLRSGGNLIVYPEGTWNKSENLLILQLFGGIYDIAKETGAVVVPVATHLEGKYVFVSVGEALDIAVYKKTEGLAVLRDEMATLKWELMERYSYVTRNELLKGRTPKEYLVLCQDLVQIKMRDSAC